MANVAFSIVLSLRLQHACLSVIRAPLGIKDVEGGFLLNMDGKVITNRC